MGRIVKALKRRFVKSKLQKRDRERIKMWRDVSAKLPWGTARVNYDSTGKKIGFVAEKASDDRYPSPPIFFNLKGRTRERQAKHTARAISRAAEEEEKKIRRKAREEMAKLKQKPENK